MRLPVVLGICFLIAISGGSVLPEGREPRCCKWNSAPSKQEGTCVPFRDIVARKAEQIDMADLTEITLGELKLKSKINAFSNAALECISRNQIYRNIYAMMDDLAGIIDTYPTPKNVLMKIMEAEELMEEYFDNLQTAQDEAGFKLSPQLRNSIDEFVDQSTDKASKIFEYNHQKAKDNTWIFDDAQISDLIDRLVNRLNECLTIKPTDFETNFECRQRVRTLGSELRDKIKDLRIMSKVKITPDQSIDRLISNFTAEEKALEDLILNDKLQVEFVRDIKSLLPLI